MGEREGHIRAAAKLLMASERSEVAQFGAELEHEADERGDGANLLRAGARTVGALIPAEAKGLVRALAAFADELERDREKRGGT